MKPFEEEEIILHLSDLHIGEKINLPENKYSLAIAKKRLDYVFDHVVRYGRDIYGKVMPIKRMHIMLTGDTVHNETMRGSAKMNAEVNLTKQVATCADYLSSAIVSMLHRFPQITYLDLHTCIGNHGRNGIPGEEDPANNYDAMMFDQLKLQIKVKLTPSLRERVQIHYHSYEADFIHTKLAGWWTVGEHGDGIRPVLKLPYYGLRTKRDMRYLQTQGQMRYYFIGHWHREYSENDGAVKTLMGLSLCGADGHAKRSGYCNLSGAKYYHISRKNGIVLDRPIYTMEIQE